jgi:hypothetical protein
MQQPLENVERPLTLVIMTVVLGVILYFGIPIVGRAHAAAKREKAYQAILGSYRQALKSGTTRREVERYLRSQGAEFSRVQNYDLSQIGVDSALVWFCGPPSVFLQFEFTAPPRSGRLVDVDGEDTLDGIEVVHKASGCV